jgi:pimeloyl-ACP methyl ester carboxylesterase
MMSDGRTALFFPSGGRQLFGFFQEPVSGNSLREAVVICSPLAYEEKKYHWTQRQIANRLQHAGYHVLRFDYFASGDSEGDSDEFDLATCRQNIQDAISFLKGTGQVRRVTVIGTRLGGLLALEALAEERVKRLVLIDPVLNGAAYLKRMQDMHQALLDENPLRAPFRTPMACHRQLLGFPGSEAFTFQLKKLNALATNPKVKSIHILKTEGTDDVTDLHAHLSGSVEEIDIRPVDASLRWDQVQALQFQDFPNDLIQKTVDAVRGIS